MSKRLIVAVMATIVILSACGCISLGPIGGGRIEEVVVERSKRFFEPNKIVILDIDGFISMARGGWPFSAVSTCVADVKERLERAQKDGNVVAVVLCINSPGGDASASDMIHHEIVRFREATNKPVVAALMGVAASGGYYSACAVDKIVAAPTCITGSIGVLMQFYNAERLLQKIGLRAETIKSGDKKDIVSGARSPTTEELAILQALNTHLHERFVDAVRAGRPGMTAEDFQLIADGRPLSAPQALEAHLIDKVGYLDEAIAEAKLLAQVADANIVRYSGRWTTNSNIYTKSELDFDVLREGLNTLFRRRGPAYRYLWAPGR